MDNDPPTITAILDLQANAAGWHKQDVTVSFVCGDPISGVAICPGPILVDGEGAAQVITGTAIDNAGNSQTTSVVINLDLTPPDVSASISPVLNTAAWNSSDPTISFNATDATSGVSSVSSDVTITTEGANQVVTGTATDLADNTATLDIAINLDKTAPTISVSSSPLPNASGWNNSDVTVSFTGSDGLSGIDTITPLITVSSEGANQLINGTAVDVAGNSASASVVLNIDLTAPVLSLTSPSDGLETNQTVLSVTGTATDINGIIDVAVNGSQAFLVGNDFELDVSLIEGSNTVTVTTRDIADNSTTQTRNVSLDSIAPVVTISSPSNLSTFNTSTVSITGTVDDPLAILKVNGVDATITGGTYTADITLGEGTRFITAVAQDPLGNTGTANISVTIDTTPPRVILGTPTDGITVFSSPITVTGMINDIVSGTVNGNNATVTVNGVSANVANRGFMAENVSLSPGANMVTAIGTDTAGNQAQASITVTLDTTAQAKINIVSGNNQTGAINTALASPLIVELVDAQGGPLANRSVTFKVTRNDGFLDSGPRSVTLSSDTLGRAQVTWTLGSYAGAGENRVEVSSPGFPGKVLFTATGVAGSASMIHPTGMSVFRGEASNALPESPQVFVSDGQGNPVQGVPVTFTVVNGSGLVNNQPQVSVTSNSDGKSHVTWILGPDEGITNNRVEATFANNTGLPVTFVASGVIPGDPTDTSFSGIVLSNTEQPIEGVTISIDGTTLTTQTDSQGQFQLTGVPVGAIHVIADGNTAILPGFTYQMMYEVNTVAGRDNTVGMPIYLLPLDLPNAQTISPSQGANIAVSSVAGFSLDIPAGGITFSDGTQTGSVSVTQVPRDKVPMPPPNGLNPKLVFTIQPAGAVFDPPAPITFPNVYGYEPGLIVTLYSFDHDLGQWVAVGTGHVTEDGAFITSDPGIGIIEGGWHFPQCAQEQTTLIQNTTNQCPPEPTITPDPVQDAPFETSCKDADGDTFSSDQNGINPYLREAFKIIDGQKHELTEKQVKALIAQESGFDPDATSEGLAVGFMQLTKSGIDEFNQNPGRDEQGNLISTCQLTKTDALDNRLLAFTAGLRLLQNNVNGLRNYFAEKGVTVSDSERTRLQIAMYNGGHGTIIRRPGSPGALDLFIAENPGSPVTFDALITPVPGEVAVENTPLYRSIATLTDKEGKLVYPTNEDVLKRFTEISDYPGKILVDILPTCTVP